MPRAWIERRRVGDGTRFRVRYRLGGRESIPRLAGTFRTMREARLRRDWVTGEIAAMRVPDVSTLIAETVLAPTITEACETWRASRHDVTEATRTLHRVALGRVTPILGTLRVDEVSEADVVRLVAELHAAGKKRETIRKSVKYLAAVLEEHGRDPNPCRSRKVRLPHEESEEIAPPLASHVEAVYRLLAPAYKLPLLWLDWSGARVASIDLLTVGDYDERAKRIRLRASTTKTRAALWVDLPAAIADTVEASLPPREDRNLDAPLFPGASADRLRTAVARACKAAGVPVFSPHDLRHRRISLLHAHGHSWAEIGRLVGQKKLSITADTYTHVLMDATELDYSALAAPR